MNNNKIIRKILIIFILIIIGILTPKEIKAESMTITPTNVTFTEEFYMWGVNTDSWEIIDEVTDGDTLILDSTSNDECTDSSIEVAFAGDTYTSIDVSWYLLCVNKDEPIVNDDLEAYIDQRAAYVQDAVWVTNPAESYQLSELNEDTYSYDRRNRLGASWGGAVRVVVRVSRISTLRRNTDGYDMGPGYEFSELYL